MKTLVLNMHTTHIRTQNDSLQYHLLIHFRDQSAMRWKFHDGEMGQNVVGTVRKNVNTMA